MDRQHETSLSAAQHVERGLKQIDLVIVRLAALATLDPAIEVDQRIRLFHRRLDHLDIATR